MNFESGGAVFDIAEEVTGRYATIQAALINMATAAGSDNAFPSRGTTLLRQAVSGALISEQEAMHAANFAAIDTVFFVRENEDSDTTDDRLDTIVTSPFFLSPQALQVDLQFLFLSGEEIGVLTTLATNG